jgi:circadian clock protein KaiB
MESIHPRLAKEGKFESRLYGGSIPMTTGNIPDSTSAIEQASVRSQQETYLLRLYITGMTPKSIRSIANIKKICEEHLQGRYTLEVIDLYQQPQLAQGEQIIATPTLIKELPHPLRRMIGDLSNTERILVGLDLRRKDFHEIAALPEFADH